LPSASASSSGPAAGSGSNPSLEGVRRFSLQSRAGTQQAGTAPPRLSSILLVEDNEGDVGLVREALEEHGVDGELTVIGDGSTAANFIADLDSKPDGCPDLVILDLNLPRLPGREVLKAMRQSQKCKDVQVAILSSSNAAQDRAQAAALGASCYITKPLRLQEFLRLGAIFRSMLP
jgi:CheY-like chemotaxis protein